MKKFWDSIFGLNDERSIWVEQEELGQEKAITLGKKRRIVKIPQNIGTNIILRLRGLGKTRGGKTGDFFLHVWLNKGADVQRILWLSETSAKKGASKALLLHERKITLLVPPGCRDGLTIRLKGLGDVPDFHWQVPFLDRKRGNLMVRLCVYPDRITPNYGSFESLSTENMALEGWVYRKIDEVLLKMGKPAFPLDPLKAETVADLFNERGWRGIFPALLDRLKLSHLAIELKKSGPKSLPGCCETTVTFRDNIPVATNYLITINEQFVDNPFSVAAILAHELCHIVYSQNIGKTPLSPGMRITTDQVSLEEERAVDLLAFMFRIGEFQLRVARDRRLTLGYFNQEVFERMQVIVTRKLGPY